EPARALPARAELGERRGDGGYGVAPPLPARIRGVQITPAVAVEVDRRLSVQGAVVALAQAPVSENGYRRRSESDSGGFDGAPQIGGEDGLEAIVASACAKLGCQDAPAL